MARWVTVLMSRLSTHSRVCRAQQYKGLGIDMTLCRILCVNGPILLVEIRFNVFGWEPEPVTNPHILASPTTRSVALGVPLKESMARRRRFANPLETLQTCFFADDGQFTV